MVCRKDEEVTISYGNWPNDVFLLFFGFLPDNNRHDAVVLFHSLDGLVHCYQALAHQQQNKASSQQQAEQPLQQEQQQLLQQTASKDLKQQHQQQPQTSQQSSNQQNDAKLQLLQQSDHTNALPTRSHQEQPSGLQCSELSSESTAPELDAGESYTNSLIADLQDRLGHGDWSR